MTEDELIDSIKRLCHASTRPSMTSVKLGIGDDAALWQPSRSHRSAISSDMLVEGVHFTLTAMSLEDVGWRAMAANVSDLAAIGARPVLATVALGIPPRMAPENVLRLYRGLANCAACSKIAIVGGDLSRDDTFTIAITVVGEVSASSAKLRSGGKPGNVLAVTGPLGASRAGLALSRHAERLGEELETTALEAFRRPRPRDGEGRFFAASRNVTAMIDCSDGLSTDVHRLAEASGCGAELDDIPVAAAAKAFAQQHGYDPYRFALAGGEDFELVVAVRPRAFQHLALRYAKRFGRPLYRIGVLREGSGVTWNGAPLERSGWDHFAKEAL